MNEQIFKIGHNGAYIFVNSSLISCAIKEEAQSKKFSLESSGNRFIFKSITGVSSSSYNN